MAKRTGFSPEDRALVLKILKKLKKYCRLKGKDIHLVEKAYDFADAKHDGVRRKDGTPYITHCLEVACILTEMDRSNEEIAAGILHDTVEDTDVKTSDIDRHFGKKVAKIVESVTNIEPYLSADCELQKKDVDELSDKKLFDSILDDCPEALYVKVADRLHNLSTMSSVDNVRRIEKVNDTRAVLIPLVRELAHAYSLADRLEDACLQAEQPHEYEKISEKYQKFLRENSEHIPKVAAYMVHSLSGETGSREYVVDCSFRERSIYSIHNDLVAQTENKSELLSRFTLRNVPLMDVFFVVRDDCPVDPEQVFYDLYEALRTGVYFPESKYVRRERFELTIVGFGKSVNSSLGYYIAADCCDVRYRIFCELEKDYKEYLHGYGIQQIRENGRNVQVNMGTSSGVFVPLITVYTRKQEKVQIEKGATVLDFAFHLHPKLAFGAKYAYLNNQWDKIPIYTKLNHGDTVEIVSSTANDRPEDEPYEEHAEIRWEEWVNTKKARKALTRYLVEKEGRSTPLIMVMDVESGRNYDLLYGAVPLDLAFAVDPVRALCFKSACINKSKVPCALDRSLDYSDKVRIEYGDEPDPSFDWVRYVRTDAARDALISYFADKIKE